MLIHTWKSTIVSISTNHSIPRPPSSSNQQRWIALRLSQNMSFRFCFTSTSSFAIFATLFFGACDRPNPKSELEKRIANMSVATHGAIHRVQWKNIRYDIRKTDSLVTPFVGRIQADKDSFLTGRPNRESTSLYDVDLEWRDEQWKIKTMRWASVSSDGFQFPPRIIDQASDQKYEYQDFAILIESPTRGR